jgi:hypothetical protein
MVAEVQQGLVEIFIADDSQTGRSSGGNAVCITTDELGSRDSVLESREGQVHRKIHHEPFDRGTLDGGSFLMAANPDPLERAVRPCGRQLWVTGRFGTRQSRRLARGDLHSSNEPEACLPPRLGEEDWTFLWLGGGGLAEFVGQGTEGTGCSIVHKSSYEGVVNRTRTRLALDRKPPALSISPGYSSRVAPLVLDI